MGGKDVEDISKRENREKKRKKLEKELALAANTAREEQRTYILEKELALAANTAREEQRTYIEKTKIAAGNTENDFANIKFTLQNINTTLEKLDRGNLSQMSEHLWWLALMAKIALVMIILSFIFSKFIIDSIH